jgi:hypothetical protein
MLFCTVINCIDGRIQLPVIEYLKKRFNVQYVDSITEAGPNLILSEGKCTSVIQSILEKLKISIEKHHSVGVAIVGHHDCAGNPAPENTQLMHIKKAAQFLGQKHENLEIIGLWVNDQWTVCEVQDLKT